MSIIHAHSSFILSCSAFMTNADVLLSLNLFLDTKMDFRLTNWSTMFSSCTLMLTLSVMIRPRSDCNTRQPFFFFLITDFVSIFVAEHFFAVMFLVRWHLSVKQCGLWCQQLWQIRCSIISISIIWDNSRAFSFIQPLNYTRRKRWFCWSHSWFMSRSVRDDC